MSSPQENEGGFEGPEKKLEIQFSEVSGPVGNGFRDVAHCKVVELLDAAKCSILSKTSNESFDAYVLSESSLFIYPKKLMLKTCGTTTLLQAIEPIITFAAECHLQPTTIFYSRKNFNFPEAQKFPHRHFDEELDYINQYFTGSVFTLGNKTKDHWNVYSGTFKESSNLKVNHEKNLEIMMSELSQEKMKQFVMGSEPQDPKLVTKQAGIEEFIPGSTIDAFCFEPCGYSMNSLLRNVYGTIHVTPEESCSFVSFETNLDTTDYTKIVQLVIDAFKPGRFSVALRDVEKTEFTPNTLVGCEIQDSQKVQTKECTLRLFNFNGVPL